MSSAREHRPTAWPIVNRSPERAVAGEENGSERGGRGEVRGRAEAWLFEKKAGRRRSRHAHVREGTHARGDRAMARPP